MRILMLTLIPILSILLESVFFSNIPLWGAIPDFILIFVTFYALTNGSRSGFGYGFMCGLLEDLYLGRFLGTNAVALALTALLIGKLEVNVFKDNVLVGAAGVLAATVLDALFMLGLAWVGNHDVMINRAMLWELGGKLILNGVLSVPLYMIYYRTAKEYFARTPDYRG